MIEFTKTKYWFKKNFIIVANGSSRYKWILHGQDFDKLVNSGNNIATIFHNRNKMAMLDFEDRITGEIVYRCEINPLSSTSDDWVVDTQV